MRKLSIIILHHNTPEDVSKCLFSLKKCILPLNTEIIVINNGGNNANTKIQESSYLDLNIKFLDTPNEGYSKGNNLGIKNTEAEYITFLNPDIILENDNFETILNYMDKNKSIGIAAPKLYYPNNDIQDNYRVFPSFIDLIIKRTFLRKIFPQRMRQYLMWDKEPNISEPVDWVTGAFLVARKECLDKVRDHDEKYFLFMSDVVICREAWDKGYEVHYIAKTKALHNEKRLSQGGIKDIFTKKTLRIHIKDAIKYYLSYFNQPLPNNSPTLTKILKKNRLLKAKALPTKSFLKNVTKKLQKNNPVVSVYKGKIVGHKSYEQPVVFFDTGVIGIVRDTKNRIGLMNIWRHIPLSFKKKNSFPVFPEVSDLGTWSLECTRGGIEKTDTSPEKSILRELYEEIGLEEKDIISIENLGRIIGNTAIDVYSHICFEIIVKDTYKFKSNEKIETIKAFKFYELSEIFQLIKDKTLFCGISQAAILQSITKKY